MRVIAVAIALSAWSWGAVAQELLVGVSKVDVTPEGPVRLGGYAARKTESEGVEQKLYARGLAIGRDARSACVLVVLDNVGVPGWLVEEVAGRLANKSGLARERLAIVCTHTHCSPLISRTFPNMFGAPIPAEQEARIDAYTKEVTEALEKVAFDALADMKAGTVWFGEGAASVAANRRTKDGPVDHSLPVIVAKGADGAVRAVVANYACHCTTLGGDFNMACGDWAGYAAENLEAAGSGSVALVTIGCGADANPSPRGKLDDARRHGAAISSAVSQVMKGEMRQVKAPPAGKIKWIELAWDKVPAKEQWEELAKKKDAIAGNARIQLEKIARGEDIARPLRYPVQAWAFGDDAAWVFLAGEVVVDYSLRLKKEFDPKRLIVTAYANDVPCYIPSRRILNEGGYEAEGAMTYYGRPGRLAPAVENDIVRAVHEVVPVSFRTKESINAFPLPKSVEAARAAFKIEAEGDLKIECVASEPLVESPVAIDWDLSGRLWVLEMRDYPTGLHEDWKAGGRVKVLTDRDGDGRYDGGRVFCEGLNFPQGLMCWRKGVLVCAAPEILYFEDGDGDGVAESKKVLFSGFSPDNRQWTVNGLAWGLDGWVYGASSIHNDPIKAGEGKVIELGARDFRMNPDTGEFEPASGRTQFCRVRDDFGNWFGNDNSTPLWHYPMEERHVRRNPHVSYPPMATYVAKHADATKLYPVSRTLERFNFPESANRVTSGCGPGIYRDVVMGESFTGNAFYCEPVHNLVQRLVLSAKGATFEGRRGKTNEKSEFLASSDNWFRPVQVRTGPDGGLYVVDMYRFVIEHPRWITPERLAGLDVRAGHDGGRIWRVAPENDARRIEKIDAAGAALAAQMNSPNGVVRDLAHRELIHRRDKATVPVLETIAVESKSAAARVQAAWTLEGLGDLKTHIIESQISDADSRVRRSGVRLAEGRLAKEPKLLERVLALAEDGDVGVRYQAALALGEVDDDRAPGALAKSALPGTGAKDQWIRAAVVNSAVRRPGDVLEAVIAANPQAARSDLARQLAELTAAVAAPQAVGRAVLAVIPADASSMTEADYRVTAKLVETVGRRGLSAKMIGVEAIARLRDATRAAAQVAQSGDDATAVRVAALGLMCRGSMLTMADQQVVPALLDARVDLSLQEAAVAALARVPDEESAGVLISRLDDVSPSVRHKIVAALCSRTEWAMLLLDAISTNGVSAADVAPDQRQRLLSHADGAVREKAGKVFAMLSSASRASLVEKLKGVLTMNGDPGRGAAVFVKNCAACHRLHGIGHAVGPDLAAVTDRSAAGLLAAIVAPNAAINGQFVAYTVETTDDRSLTGIVAEENAAGLVVAMGNGIREAVKRSEIKSISTSRLSLMPEGLEEVCTAQELADVIAFVADPQTAESLATRILDPASTNARREEAVKARPEFQVEIVRELTKDLAAGTDEEYRRIPWIWRCAVAVGKRNDEAEIRRLLEVATPAARANLLDWQAVVIGGGVVNGITLAGDWPDQRIEKILAGDEGLLARYLRANELAAAMADDPKVKDGTRYDALRMIAMLGWERAGEQLKKYLKGNNAELQQGAVSGLADMRSREAAGVLIEGMARLTAGNREFALEGLVRTEQGAMMLLDAVEKGVVDRKLLGEKWRERLRKHGSVQVRGRAERVL